MEYLIEIYPFNGNAVEVLPTDSIFVPNKKLGDYIEKEWISLKNKNYKSNWIPIVSRISSEKTNIKISAGVMDYKQTLGCLQAIKNHKKFAPKQENIPPAINNLSIGIIPITSDGYTLLRRRAFNLHAGGVWNFPGGYISSLMFNKENCDKPEYSKDPRLFDISFQLNQRAHQRELYGLSPEDIELGKNPLCLCWGFYHSLEMELGFVANPKKTKNEVECALKSQNSSEGKEYSKLDFIAVEDLETLIKNQPLLLNENPLTYEPKDLKKLILLDLHMGHLIGGGLEKIIGNDLNPCIKEELIQKNLSLRTNNISKDSICFKTDFSLL